MSLTRPGSIDARDGVYRRGFGLKAEIAEQLTADYYSELVERVRAEGCVLQLPGGEIRLAREFGFCYGVDKAIDFAYETRRKFPQRRIFLTAEIIHNPGVNRRLADMGIEFLSGQYAAGGRIEDLQPEDVVLLPAFGVGMEELDRLKRTGCVLVDTTCGSVVHVWKRVEQYAREGFTSIVHGKHDHEETIATASRAYLGGRGRYLIVLDGADAELVCDFIRDGPAAAAPAERFAGRTSPGFDFARDLERIGVANQTTMLSSESLAIAEMFRQAILQRYGEAELSGRFRSFDTICNATQERQDAVIEMMEDPPDVMIVLGGFNSSNTRHLCEIASAHCPAYHVESAADLISRDRIRHKPPGLCSEPRWSEGWWPTRRPIRLGLTAGASTPNKVVGEVIERLREWVG